MAQEFLEVFYAHLGHGHLFGTLLIPGQILQDARNYSVLRERHLVLLASEIADPLIDFEQRLVNFVHVEISVFQSHRSIWTRTSSITVLIQIGRNLGHSLWTSRRLIISAMEGLILPRSCSSFSEVVSWLIC